MDQTEFKSANLHHKDENVLVFNSRCKYVHLITHRAPQARITFMSVVLRQNYFCKIVSRELKTDLTQLYFGEMSVPSC